MKDIYDIAVVHGDGIGPEVGSAALMVLNAAFNGKAPLRFEEHSAGAQHFVATGVSLPKETFDACRAADAILHGAAGLPGVNHADGTEAGLDFTLTLRSQLDLYANVRPIKLISGIQSPLRSAKGGDIDYVIVRENSEGLYAARGAGSLLRDEVAVDTLVQTRKGVERIVRFAFELARIRNGAPSDGRKRVTCCDKANVLRSFAFFRSVFDQVASEYPDIEAEHVLVDAMTVHMVNRPSHFDVIVCENMFGDILSDLGAATIGGMGMAPSAELGEASGLFQASHGSAPDIAGKGLANPYGTVLAAGSMLMWLGMNHLDNRLIDAARRIEGAVTHVVSEHKLSRDLGGTSGTREIAEALSHYLAADTSRQ